MLIRRNFSHIHRDSVETKLTRFQKFQRFCACNQKKRYPVRRREALIFRMKTCLNSWYRRHVSFKMYRLYFFLKKLGNQIFKKYLVNVSVIPFICLHVFHADFFLFPWNCEVVSEPVKVYQRARALQTPGPTRKAYRWTGILVYSCTIFDP